MMSESISNAGLRQLLIDLGFHHLRSKGSHVVYRHAATDTIVVLAGRLPEAEARTADLAAVERLLIERGIIDRSALTARLHACAGTEGLHRIRTIASHEGT